MADEGVWRTIGGRRVFIRTGESLTDAMAKSGKFAESEIPKQSMQEQIRDALDDGEYQYYGIRVEDDVTYEVGDEAHESRVWDDGEPTDEVLDGTSCVGIKWNATDADIADAITISKSYFGDDIYLIAGNDMEYGEDAGEFIT